MNIRTFKRSSISIVYYMMILAVLAYALSAPQPGVPAAADTQYDWEPVLNGIFSERNDILLTGDTDRLNAMYAPGEQNSAWALEYEIRRTTHLAAWSARQGVKFTGIRSELVIKRVRKVGRGYAFFIMASTTYTYTYEDSPEKENIFRIGTYHSLDLIPDGTENSWAISREWYLDPFQDTMNASDEETEQVRQFIASQSARDFSDISEARKKAAAYADRWAGAACGGEEGYSYNKNYPNFSRDGDCGNYVSQCLHESGFKTVHRWNFNSSEATRSWCNADGLEGYLVWSGKAYVLAKGTYGKVYQSAFQLEPGDVVAYVQKGNVVHVAIVTGADAKGVALVNSHTTDRFHVPWDLGWNSAGNKFIFLKVNYPS